jgi:5-formyltetrahydrofolate cyclo-ligase
MARRRERRAAFKEERRKISPEEQQARDNNGGNPQLYLVSRSWEAKHEGCLIQGNKNARLMGNNYPPSLP